MGYRLITETEESKSFVTGETMPIGRIGNFVDKYKLCHNPILRVYGQLVSLRDPSNTWAIGGEILGIKDSAFIDQIELLPEGTSVKIFSGNIE